MNLTDMKIKLKNELKINYEIQKQVYLSSQKRIDRLKQNGEEISNCHKYNLLFLKSIVCCYAGIYNNDKALFEKSLKQYKKYGLEYLDALGDDDGNIKLQIQHTEEIIEKGLNVNNEIYKKSEAYRQFAEYLKIHTKDFEDYKTYWNELQG